MLPLLPLLALSIERPWAWAAAAGVVANIPLEGSWAFLAGQRLALYTPEHGTTEGHRRLAVMLREFPQLQPPTDEEKGRLAILGVATVSRVYQGPSGRSVLVLADPLPLLPHLPAPEPKGCALWSLEPSLRAAVARAIRQAEADLDRGDGTRVVRDPVPPYQGWEAA